MTGHDVDVTMRKISLKKWTDLLEGIAETMLPDSGWNEAQSIQVWLLLLKTLLLLPSKLTLKESFLIVDF